MVEGFGCESLGEELIRNVVQAPWKTACLFMLWTYMLWTYMAYINLCCCGPLQIQQYVWAYSAYVGSDPNTVNALRQVIYVALATGLVVAPT